MPGERTRAGLTRKCAGGGKEGGARGGTRAGEAWGGVWRSAAGHRGIGGIPGTAPWSPPVNRRPKLTPSRTTSNALVIFEELADQQGQRSAPLATPRGFRKTPQYQNILAYAWTGSNLGAD